MNLLSVQKSLELGYYMTNAQEVDALNKSHVCLSNWLVLIFEKKWSHIFEYDKWTVNI